MSHALPPPRFPWLGAAWTLAAILVVLGGQCRGSLVGAQASLEQHAPKGAMKMCDGDDCFLTRAGVEARKADIKACKAHGGIPVVIAGPVSSEGTVGCAAPLGYEP